MPIISELFIYPLKSAKGLSLSTIAFNQRGPIFDRHWMVINPKKKFLTQRQKPKMCLINTALSDQTLTLSAPEMPRLELPVFDIESLNQRIHATVWHDTVDALDCGDLAAQWISDYLMVEGCRLVYMPDDTQRQIDTNYAKRQETVSFADGFPSLIISQASLTNFNKKLNQPISMANFRPNIVIDNCEAYAEDQWKEIKVAGITFSLVKPCSRCIIPSIEQDTANRQTEVTDALNKHRRRDRATYFGQNALHDTSGIIRVGDTVEIIR